MFTPSRCFTIKCFAFTERNAVQPSNTAELGLSVAWRCYSATILCRATRCSSTSADVLGCIIDLTAKMHSIVVPERSP